MDGTRAGRTIGRTVGRRLGGLTLLAAAACSPPANGGNQPAAGAVPLPKPVEQFDDAGEFLRFARGGAMGWRGIKQERRCRGPECEGNGRKTRVSLEAPGYAGSVDLQKLGPTGVVVAMLRNEGDHTEARYGLAPKGGFLNHRSVEYYYVVQPLPAGTTPSDTIRALLKRVVVTTRGWGLDRDIRVETIGARFGACPVPHEEHEKPDHVGFLNCRTAAGTPPGAAAVRRSNSEIDAAWIDCHHGCCYMGESEA